MREDKGFFRGRRFRQTGFFRELIKETYLHPGDLVQPYFVVETEEEDFIKEIPSMPGQYQLSIRNLILRLKEAMEVGLKAIILFGIPATKDEMASSAYDIDGIIQRTVREVKERFPELIVITDVCLCEYTSHGHCGIVKNGKVLNDPTLELLAKTALSHVEAGADMVAPSDMMDGRIGYIREVLDSNGFEDVPIMSYAVKYCSGFYGPFREAAHSAPVFGDRRTYQMDPPNSREALREASADILEGADVIMVKPALAYLDIIHMIKGKFDVPVAAYQVSGEYSMIKAAASRGWLDEDKIVYETLIGIKRAGADMILSYFSVDVLRQMSSGKGWL